MDRGGVERADLDHRGSRRLGPVEQWVWYLLAGATYIGLGVWHKWLLNWFVGPVWLVAFVVIGPWLWDRARTVALRARAAVLHQ